MCPGLPGGDALEDPAGVVTLRGTGSATGGAAGGDSATFRSPCLQKPLLALRQRPCERRPHLRRAAAPWREDGRRHARQSEGCAQLLGRARCRSGTSSGRKQGQLWLTNRVGCEAEGLDDVLGFQIRVGAEDIRRAHAVGDHPHDRGYRYAQVSNAGNAPHAGSVGCNPGERHRPRPLSHRPATRPLQPALDSSRPVPRDRD